MKVKCPECGKMHVALVDYKEMQFGKHCDSCNDKAHEKFIKKYPWFK